MALPTSAPVPALLTSTAPSPQRASMACWSLRSMYGERQTLPVQTVKILAGVVMTSILETVGQNSGGITDDGHTRSHVTEHNRPHADRAPIPQRNALTHQGARPHEHAPPGVDVA